MAPAIFHQEQQQHARSSSAMNGPRPSPLRINQASHLIKKPNKDQQNRKQPVIIYTHSPKIIHTQARDFMALVQKLTGLSKPDEARTARNNDDNTDRPNVLKDDSNEDWLELGARNNYQSSSAVDKKKDRVLARDNDYEKQISSSSLLKADDHNYSPSSSNDFFTTPRVFWKFADTQSPSQNMAKLLSSPSFMELLKGLHEN